MEILKPPVSLLCKLASIVVHADEANSADGHQLDVAALNSALHDPEVADWIAGMTAAALAPSKRTLSQGSSHVR